MATITVHVDGLPEALGLEFSFRDYFEDHAAELTTEHPASSYGLPVLVRDGKVYGPADLPNATIVLGNTEQSGSEMIAAAQAAGWNVRIADVR